MNSSSAKISSFSRTFRTSEVRLFVGQVVVIPAVMTLFALIESRYTAGFLASILFFCVGAITIGVEGRARQRSLWVRLAAITHLLLGFLPVFALAQLRRAGLLPEALMASVGKFHALSSLIYLHLILATLVWAIRSNYHRRP
jgi:uncharacterized membrane protein HdeD (DUF308 family)